MNDSWLLWDKLMVVMVELWWFELFMVVWVGLVVFMFVFVFVLVCVFVFILSVEDFDLVGVSLLFVVLFF